LDGDIAEVLLFSRGLNDVERLQVEAYLASKYELASLPVTSSVDFGNAEGIFSGSQTVTLTGPSDSIIYYTTDGSTPTTASPIYSGPLTVSATALIQAIAVKVGHAPSAVTSVRVVIDPATALLPINDALVWLRSDAGVITDASSNVTSWRDQSGNNRHASQATAVRYPSQVGATLNGLPVLRFDGTTTNPDHLTIPNDTGLNPSQISIFTVAKRTSGAAAAGLVSKWPASGATGYRLEWLNATTVRSAINSSTVTTGIAPSSTFFTLSSVYDQVQNRLFANGVQLDADALTTVIGTNISPFHIGSQSTTTAPFGGDLAEVIVIGRAVTEQERLDIELYLQQRYALATPGYFALAPTFSHKTGTYASSLSFTMAAPAGSEIRYTTDGSAPTAASTLYSTALDITATTTIKAIAIRPGYANSPVNEAVLSIDASTAIVPRNGLSAWFIGGRGVEETGGIVEGWRDQSGLQNDAAQTVSGNRPTLLASAINSQPAVAFAGSPAQFLTVPDHTSLKGPQASVFTVVKRTTGVTIAGVVSKWASGANGYRLEWSNGTTARYALNNGGTPVATVPINTYRVLAGVYDQVNNRIYVNGVQAGTLASTGALANAVSNMTLGSQNGATNPLAGEVAEVLVYNRGVTAEERTDVDAYLFAKYGIGTQPTTPGAPAISLPAGTYASGQSITISAPPGYQIYYTLDGSAPTSASTLYTGPFLLQATATIRAILIRQGYLPGAEASVRIAIDSSTQSVTRSGLQLWLRADEGTTTNGSALTQWNDQSGAGNHAAQATAIRQPALVPDAINGTKPVIRFTSASLQHLIVPHTSTLAGAQMTVIAVAKKTSGTAPILLEKYTTGATPLGYSLQFSSTGALWKINALTPDPAGTLTTNTFGVLSGTYDQVQSRLFINSLSGTTLAATAAIGASANPLYIGGRSTTTNLNGDVAELLVYNRALTLQERQNVEAYLGLKYGLTLNALSSPAPSINVPGGSYTLPQNVTIDAPNPSVIYYTTDGSTPTTASPVYNGNPIAVAAGQAKTIRAIAVYGPGYAPSAEVRTSVAVDEMPGIVPRTGLKLWLRSDNGVVASGGLVSAWEDQSFNDNHALQAASTRQPTLVSNEVNGLPVLRFGATTTTVMEVPHNAVFNAGQQYSLVAVYRRNSGTGPNGVMGRGRVEVAGYSLDHSTGSAVAYVMQTATNNNFSSLTTPFANGSFGLVASTLNGSQHRLYLNGTLAGSQSTPYVIPSGTYPFKIGGMGTLYSLQGDLAEVFFYNQPLTDTERRSLEAYIYLKYQIGNPPVPEPPTFGPAQTFVTSMPVTITAPAGFTIHYTLDGSDPTTASPVYNPASKPIISQTTTVKAAAIRAGYVLGPVASSPVYTKDATSTFTRNGLAAWFRGDVGVVYGIPSTLVSSWADQSGFGNHLTQTVVANQPIYAPLGLNGSPGVYFNPATNDYSDFMTAPNHASLNSSERTVFVVFNHYHDLGTTAPPRNHDTSTAAVVLRKSVGTGSGWGFTRLNNANSFGFWVHDPATFKVSDQVRLGPWLLCEATQAYQQMNLYVNSEPKDQDPAPLAYVPDTAPLLMGGGGSGTVAQAFTGVVLETLIFNRALSFQETLEVEKYLSLKYGLDTDADNDGLPRWQEEFLNTDSNNPDTNGNGLNDGDEVGMGFNPFSLDTDGDGLTNAQEFALGTNSFWADTDGDGVNDSLDAFPFDPAYSSAGSDPTPTTAPTAALILPINAVPIP
jgi:hypothetical protein